MPSHHLDALDLRILGELQDDAKVTNVDLAARVRLSPSPCLARVRGLESANVINRYVTLLDPHALGLHANVFVEVVLDRPSRETLDAFERAIRELPEVMECHLMSGDADYLLRVIVPDISELEKFVVEKLAPLPGIARIRSRFSLKQVKYQTTLPLPLPSPP